MACLTTGPVRADEMVCQTAKATLSGANVVPVLRGLPCDLIQSTDGAQYFCALEFPFRSDGARDTYAKYVAAMRGCFKGVVETAVRLGVNHPDSYDQTVFDVQGRQISIALKDKGALQKTYVFVRLPAH